MCANKGKERSDIYLNIFLSCLPNHLGQNFSISLASGMIQKYNRRYALKVSVKLK